MRIGKKLTKQILIFVIALAAALLVTAVFSKSVMIETAEEYSQYLDRTIVTVDETQVNMQTMGYYIMTSERNVDAMAQDYDPKDTFAFWRLHFNSVFIVTEAKESAMNTCVRDVVYCLEADAAGVSLNEAELAQAAAEATEVYQGLSLKQQEALQFDEASLTELMEQIHLARKYANMLVDTVDFEPYEETAETAVEIGGAYYNEILAKHEVETNDRLWAKVHLGDITIQKVDF